MRTVQYLALACLIGSAMPAYCQAPQANDKVKLEVSRANLQIIGQALMEIPYKTAAPVLNDLQMQLNASDAAAAKEAAEKPKSEEKPAEKAAQ